MVRDRSHDAAVGGQAVPAHANPALVRGVVERVDVVPGRGVGEAGDVADAVGEEGGGCGVLGVEERGEEGVRGVCGWDVQEGERDGCAVAEGAPGCGWG